MLNKETLSGKATPVEGEGHLCVCMYLSGIIEKSSLMKYHNKKRKYSRSQIAEINLIKICQAPTSASVLLESLPIMGGLSNKNNINKSKNQKLIAVIKMLTKITIIIIVITIIIAIIIIMMMMIIAVTFMIEIMFYLIRFFKTSIF